jgi:hypothetical protein
VWTNLLKVLLSLEQRLVSGEEVGDELFARLVHDTPDHGLGHHLHLLGRGHASRGGVRVKYNLSRKGSVGVVRRNLPVLGNKKNRLG